MERLKPESRFALLLACGMLALAVLIGAFGAHGLKAMVTADKLATFETGVRYHFYHAFGLFLLGLLLQAVPTLNLRVSIYAFLAGILLFSFNCYFYVLSEVKVFAMLVPA